MAKPKHIGTDGTQLSKKVAEDVGYVPRRFSYTREGIIWFCALLTTLIAMSCIMYWPFLSGARELIFVEVGSDSFAQSVPFFRNAALRFREGTISSWNPSQFLGASTFETSNPEYLVSLLGPDALPFGLAVSQVAKVVLAGVFFYLYAGWLGVDRKTQYVTAVGYAFGGRIVALACWTAYASEVTIAAMLLWGLERFFHDRHKFIGLPVSFALMIGLLSIYGMVLYTGILLAYSLVRLVYLGGCPDGVRSTRRLVAQLVLLYLCSVLLAAPALLPLVHSYSQSARVGTTHVAMDLRAMLVPTSPKILAEEVIKLFSVSGMGYMEDYKGALNILNTPYYYCGILTICGVIPSFFGKTRQQRVGLAIALGAALAYVLVPALRYVMNGFALLPDDYRNSSFWVVLVLSYLGALGVDRMWEESSASELALGFGVPLAAFCIASLSLWDHVFKRYIALAAAIACLYFLVLLMSRRMPRYHKFAWALLVLVPLEVIASTLNQAQVVPTIDGGTYQASFGNNAAEALATANEDTTGVRIDDRGDLLTSGMVGNCLTTKTYIGGVGMSTATTEFLKSQGSDYIEAEGYTRYVYGFNTNETNTMLGVGYRAYWGAAEADAPAQYVPFGYSEVFGPTDWTLLKNDYALPLIYAYPQGESMSKSAYYSLNRDLRDDALLQRIVLPDYLQAATTDSNPEIAVPATPQTVAAAKEPVTEADAQTLTLPEEGRMGYLLVDADLSAQATESGNYVLVLDFYTSQDSDHAALTMRYRTAVGNEHASIPVEDQGFVRLVASIESVNNTSSIEVSNLSVGYMDKTYFDPYVQTCEERRGTCAGLTAWSNDSFEADVTIDEDGYAVSPIAYDNQWKAYVDGTECPVFCANIGFLGTAVPAGTHHVRFVYDNTPLYAGYAMCATCVAGLLIVKLAGPRLARARK